MENYLKKHKQAREFRNSLACCEKCKSKTTVRTKIDGLMVCQKCEEEMMDDETR